jgi:thioredoxin
MMSAERELRLMGAIAKVALAMVVAYGWHRLAAPAGGGCPLLCSPWRALAVGAVLGLLWASAAPATPPPPVGRLSVLLGGMPKEKTMNATITSGAVAHLTEEEFVKLVGAAHKPILLDAFATWCGPCRMLAPELDKAAASLGERVTVAKIDVDQCPRLSQSLGIRGVPALFLIDGDRVIGNWTGFASAEAIVERVEQRLGS